MLQITQPIQVGRKTIKNRLVMAPVMIKKAEKNRVSQAILDYYDSRTRSGKFGLVVLEHSFITEAGKSGDTQISVADDEAIDGLAKLAKTVHRNGSMFLLQMNHLGSAAKREITGTRPLSASAVRNPAFPVQDPSAEELPEEMSTLEIKTVIQQFVNAAVRAKIAGFDGCEIHSAHGYLLNQFLSPLTNQRTDFYTGRNLAGRIRLHLEVIRAVRAAVGHDFLISMRLGGCDYLEGGNTVEDAAAAAKAFEKMGLDLLNVSGGMCRYDRPGHKEAGYFSDESEAVKKVVSIPVILTGGVKDIASAEVLLKAGKADMIGIGRANLMDENWAAREMP